MEKQPRSRNACTEKRHDYVFTRDDGKPVRDFRGAWDAACEAAKVPGYSSTICGERRREISVELESSKASS
jgi:hypothetical protein